MVRKRTGSTAAFIHGGGDLAIKRILTHLMVDSMMTYSGGQSYGMPVIHLDPVTIAPQLERFADLFRTYGNVWRRKQQLVPKK